ncbi:MAG: oxygen-independent coproporphyrinogen III oxidase [Pseudomonadota bacterium]
MNVLDILNHYGASAPRYTSYPTAPHFRQSMGQSVFEANVNAMAPNDPVSVYIHIPFCDKLCWFCGCHTKHTNKYEPVADYITALLDEIALVGKQLPFKPLLGALHFGGGSPSLLRADDLGALKIALEMVFAFNNKTEISFEIDPSDALERTFDAIADFGITRVSLGVQDFDPLVQRAINRIQTFEQTLEVVQEFRRLGVTSLNIDALYGLPHQTETRLRATLDKCLSLEPDRIALFGYAHVPWIKKHQKLIKDEHLPDIEARFQQAQLCAAQIGDAGYQTIGIDHFAKPGDSLALAARAGTMRRNFQGYTTDAFQTLFGLGGSSIGKGAAGYVQNIVPTNTYRVAIKEGRVPVDKGLLLSDEDKYRAALIEQLMCRFEVDFASLGGNDAFIERALDDVEAFQSNDPFGLTQWDDATLKLTPEARPFVRTVAHHFDQYRQPNSGAKRYSLAV